MLIDLAALPPELQEAALCLQQAFGEETFSMLLAGEYVPAITDLAKLGECDIDLALLTTIVSVEGVQLPPIIQDALVTGTSADDIGY